MLRVALGGFLGDLPSERGGTKGVKIEIVSERKNDLASERGSIKHTGQCRGL